LSNQEKNSFAKSRNSLTHPVHAALYGMLFMNLCKQFTRFKDAHAWKTYHIRLHVQKSLAEDKHKMFETCRRQEELN
jgi:hypothetical protein